MRGKYWKKGEVIAAMALILFSALFIAGNLHALEPKKGSIEFVLLYKDAESGDTYYLSNVKAYLFDMNGKYISNYTSSPNGIVKFNNIEYGNYVIKTPNIRVGDYVYQAGFDVVKLNATGQYSMSGGDFTSITVERYPLTHYLNFTIMKNGLPVIADAYFYFNKTGYCFESIGGNSTYNITVPMGTIGIKIVYTQGGVEKEFYRDLYIPKSQKYINTKINLDSYYRILGTVKSSTTIVNTTVHITILNKSNGEIWKVLKFNGGAFSFYLPSSNYRLVITADGYNIKTVNANNFLNINLNPVENNVNYNIEFSENMKWVNISYTIEISNKTILYSLPHNNTGVLYYQLKMLGWNANDLKNYLSQNYKMYTNNLVSVDGNIYELSSVKTTTWSVENPSQEGYLIGITAHYTNSEIKKENLLNDKKINVNLYARENTIEGAKMIYSYQMNISSDLERSNDITNANVSGFIHTIFISDVKESPVIIILKERKSPTIYLDSEHFTFGWENMTDVNHIVNQSKDNYTIVIPAYKNVWFNASKIAYDVVRDKIDSDNTTYTWIIDNSTYRQGKGVYNITKSFPRGLHTMEIKVEDIGENTNTTNITILSDNIFPTVNITIKDPSGKVIATLITSSTYISRIDYTINGYKGHSWYNWTTKTVVINHELTFNESQEIAYISTSYDTYDTVNKTNLPVIVEWNFNGNKSTGDNRSFSFDVPTRGHPYFIDVTLRDSVNNSITISLPDVIVRDITPPVVKLNFTYNGTTVTEVKEGEDVSLNASASYDPENGTISSYNWTIEDSNYKVIKPTDGIYDILNNVTYTLVDNGSFIAPSDITLVFHKYGTYYIILNVTDADGNYNIVNKTLRIAPVRPDLAISDVSIKGDRIEGSQIKFEVNVTNNGNAIAESYWISLIVNGKTVFNKTYHNLKNGSYQIHTAVWVPNSPGNYTVKIKVGTPGEPPSYLSDNEKDEHVVVSPAPWKTPAMVIGVIVVIGVIGYIGWVAMKKKGSKKGFRKKSKKEKKEKKEKS